MLLNGILISLIGSKWDSNGVRSSDADNVYNYLEGEGIPMRGHTFFWGMINNNQASASNQMWDPDWVEARMNANPPDAWYWMSTMGCIALGRKKLMSGILIMRWDMVIGTEIHLPMPVHMD